MPLPKTYLLPGERLELPVKGKQPGAAGTVTIWPATVYGYAVGTHAITLSGACKPTPGK